MSRLGHQENLIATFQPRIFILFFLMVAKIMFTMKEQLVFKMILYTNLPSEDLFIIFSIIIIYFAYVYFESNSTFFLKDITYLCIHVFIQPSIYSTQYI